MVLPIYCHAVTLGEQSKATTNVVDNVTSTNVSGNWSEDGTWSGFITSGLEETYKPKVTALHSLNSYLADSGSNVFYIPQLSDFKLDIPSSASKTIDVDKVEHSFAAVYDGYFNNEVKSSVATSGDTYYNVSEKVYREESSRALEVLGYDMLLKNESVSVKSVNGKLEANYSATELDSDNIDLLSALMASYKAMGKEVQKVKFCYTTDNSLALETSPMQQYVTDAYGGNVKLDVTEGKTWVWMTRTDRQQYEDKVLKDNLTLSQSGLEKILTNSEATEANKTDVEYALNKTISLGEFCVYLKELMLKYGEPIMLEQEEALLIQVYGKDLPYYVVNNDDSTVGEEILDSIKYMYAKGILNPEDSSSYDFAGNLTIYTMLDMLMAVKDVDSRYTFKSVDVDIDSELSNLGYYETTVLGYTSPILSMSASTAAGAEYYDYIVEARDGITNFKEDDTLVLDGFCIKTKDGKLTRSSGSGVFYFAGITSNGEYHFKIKAGNSYLTKYIKKNKYITISCYNKNVDVKSFNLNLGGGVYKIDGTSITQSTFNSVYGSSEMLDYVDSARKTIAQTSSTDELSKTIKIKFTLSADTWKDDLTKMRWASNVGDTAGESLASLKTDAKKFKSADGKYTIVLSDVDTNGLCWFSVSGCVDLAEFRSHIIHSDLEGRYSEYQTYCQNGENILVNFDYLQDVGIAKRYMELDDDVLLLTTPYNNIYLCPKQNMIIVGNTFYDMPSDSLMYYKKDGKLFIDYRAALGWCGDYYVFQEEDGTISLTLPKKIIEANLGKVARRQIYTPFGTFNDSSSKTGSNSSHLATQMLKVGTTYSLLLTSNYPLANYILFDGSDAAESSTGDTDYLFVFKQKSARYETGEKVTELYKDDTKARDLLKGLMGAEAPDGWLVYTYILYKESDAAGKNPPGITYSSRYGYLYTPSEYTSDWEKRYYKSCLTKEGNLKGTVDKYNQKDDIILPFITGTDTTSYISGGIKNRYVFDINFNIFKLKGKYLTYGRAPCAYLFDEDIYTKNTATWKPGYTNSIVNSDTVGKVSDFDMLLAPTSVISSFINTGTMTASSVKKDSSIIYLGTIRSTLKEADAQTSHYTSGEAQPDVRIAGQSYGTLGSANLEVFNILRSTNLGYVLGISSMESLTITDERSNVSSKPGINIGLSLTGFDWSQFKFKNLVENADDFITIAMIAILNFIPRIAMFIFLCLIALSLVTNIRIWIWFCDHIFDPYKIFTLWRQDVHTINTFTLFWTSILAMAVFGLFMDGTIINVIAWFVEAGVGITMR